MNSLNFVPKNNILSGSLLIYNKNNEMIESGIIINEDINLGEKSIINVKSIGCLKFTTKGIDLQYKRLSNLSNPKFLNDAVTKGYTDNRIEELLKRIEVLESKLKG